MACQCRGRHSPGPIRSYVIQISRLVRGCPAHRFLVQVRRPRSCMWSVTMPVYQEASEEATIVIWLIEVIIGNACTTQRSQKINMPPAESSLNVTPNKNDWIWIVFISQKREAFLLLLKKIHFSFFSPFLSFWPSPSSSLFFSRLAQFFVLWRN